MPFEDITDAGAVRRALEEFREVGRAGFSKNMASEHRGVGWFKINGKEYDAKAILGAAHGYQHRTGPLPQTEFYGGRPTARKLRELGFTVTDLPLGATLFGAGTNLSWRSTYTCATGLHFQVRTPGGNRTFPSFESPGGDDRHRR